MNLIEEREAHLEGYFKVTMVRDAHFVGSSPRTDLLIEYYSETHTYKIAAIPFIKSRGYNE